MAKKLSKTQKENLSTNAKKLYKRILEGRWYSYEKEPPLAMKELIDAGLVRLGGRVKVIEKCYVPKKGFRNFKMETWSEEDLLS